MKVLFIEPFQLDDSLGGSHKSLYDIILGIKENDNDVLLASTNRGGLTKRLDKYQIATDIFYAPKILETNVKICGKEFYNYFSLLINGLFFTIPIISLYKLIRNYNPNIIHSNELFLSIPLCILCKIMRKPLIVHIRWIPTKNVHSLVIKMYSMIISRFADSIIFNSKVTKGYYSKYMDNKKTEVIYNGVKRKIISKSKTNKIINSIGLDLNLKTIGVFGRVIEMKGHHILLRSLNQLKKNNIKLNLIVVGGLYDKRYVDYIKKMIKNYRLENVYLLGFKYEIQNYISICDILVAPSIINESFGRTLIEGLSQRIPLVASNIGAHSEIIDDGINGYLYDHKSTDELTKCISDLITNDKLKIKFINNGYNKYINEFRKEKMLDSLVSTFTKVNRKS